MTIYSPQNPEKMSPVFITGASGFIGGKLAEHFLAEGREVRSVTSNPDYQPREGLEAVEMVHCDIADESNMGILRDQMDGCKTVYHCAGLNKFCAESPGILYDVNVSGTDNVVWTATLTNGVRRLINLSSVVTIGEARGTVAKEDSVRARGNSFLSDYEASKYYAEQAAKTRAGNEIELVTINPVSVQGPGRSTGTAGMLLRVLNGEKQFLPPTAEISVLDVRDCITALTKAETLARAGERYVLSGSTMTIEDAVGLIEAISGMPSGVKFVSDKTFNLLGGLDCAVKAFQRKPQKSCKEFRQTILYGTKADGTKASEELELSYVDREGIVQVGYTPVRQTFTDTAVWLRDEGLVKRDILV